MRFLILGATGMAGHVIAIYLKEQGHEVTALTRRPFPYCENIIADITNLPIVSETINNGKYDAVINCIGILNEFAEENKHQAVFLNSYLPHYLSYQTRESKTKIIHMSTDCVFSGKSGNYNENSIRDGETFYDRSKALGELENEKDLTFRNSIIGPDINEYGIGLFNWFMEQNGEINGFTKAIWTGVTTLTLAKAMEKAMENNLAGLYNLVNNDSITKYELLKLFNKYFKDNKLTINKSDKVSLDKSLINSRNDFDFVVPSYEEMIMEMKEWVVSHKELYPHYFNLE
ncbi:SDR family oxidoreductase [Metabacillus sediminilitoris]|uniref:dTDP-4-dehydrorhamnose reductase n=1 Tax=Metabacillus sediminilitoris TaxID=2567941 RepID=A0A4S4C2T7_9BACI|nr:sugar nucleotide-binding protein [Metabacillus sediminilitoris]QGQ48273.1 sugar nucleotide-binding protein [Metabacillus sediminilitoris]THF81369.1 NAD-dependent epimerase/dehydratase family protein [Metabacillus sediminilitoris]